MKQLLLTLLCLLGLLLSALLACAADAHTASPKPVPTLYIGELRDTGGLPDQDDGTKLNINLTMAFRKIIANEAKGAVSVVDKPAMKNNSNAAWALEGDISGVNNGQGTTNYLCVMRLYREGKKRELLAQWSGVADTLRFLTGNIPHIKAVHENGLVGEIGQRALNVIRTDGKVDLLQALTDIGKTLPEAKGATITLSVGGGTAVPVSDNVPQLSGGMPFTVDVASPDAGPYVFAVLGESDIHLARLQQPVKETGGYERLHFTTPGVKEAVTVRLFFFLRAKSTQQTAEQPAPAAKPDEAILPVRIQEVVTRPAQTNDTIADVLLTLLQSDPPGSWLLKSVDLQIAPGK